MNFNKTALFVTNFRKFKAILKPQFFLQNTNRSQTKFLKVKIVAALVNGDNSVRLYGEAVYVSRLFSTLLLTEHFLML